MRAIIVAACVSLAQPVFAQDNPRPISIDRETGCWTSISEDYEWKIPVRKAGLFIFVTMANSQDAGGEQRQPVLWLMQDQPDDSTAEWEAYNDRWSVMQLPKTGDYYLTYAPRAWFGARGEVSVCLRTSKAL